MRNLTRYPATFRAFVVFDSEFSRSERTLCFAAGLSDLFPDDATLDALAEDAMLLDRACGLYLGEAR